MSLSQDGKGTCATTTLADLVSKPQTPPARFFKEQLTSITTACFDVILKLASFQSLHLFRHIELLISLPYSIYNHSINVDRSTIDP